MLEAAAAVHLALVLAALEAQAVAVKAVMALEVLRLQEPQILEEAVALVHK